MPIKIVTDSSCDLPAELAAAYFGDATQSWGYYLVAVAGGGLWTI